ncbi:hypothetical protein BH11PAT1_BH11PAT1_2280 [soil metagenome]
MDNTQLQKIKDVIATADKVGIAVGENPTVDDMAAALSLYLTLTQANKAVSIASPTEPIVELSSLVGIDKVQTNFTSNSGDLIVSFPYREGEIEKVSYTIDDEKSLLNIVVKAGEQGLTFDQNDVVYTRGTEVPTVLFVIGTPRLTNLGTLFAPDGLKDTQVINIDNKEENQKFGDLVLVSPKFSSVSEQVADLIFALNLPVELDTAQNLLSGISYATNNFQDPKTSYVAFEIAAMLMKRGAQRSMSQVRVTREQAPKRDFSQFLPNLPKQQPAQGGQKTQQKQAPMQQRQQQIQNQLRQEANQTQPMTQQPEPVKQEEQKAKNPPADWLTPKVYSGSSKV